MEDKNGTLHCHFINMDKLRKWFFENQDNYRKKITKQINKTVFSVVPIRDIQKYVGIKIVKV